MSAAQCLDQCILVHQTAACAVNQPRASLHFAKSIRVEQIVRGLVERTVQRHDVGLGEKRI